MEGEDLLELATIVSLDFSHKNGEDLLELPLLPSLVLSSDPNSISSTVKSGEGCKGLGFINRKFGFLGAEMLRSSLESFIGSRISWGLAILQGEYFFFFVKQLDSSSL